MVCQADVRPGELRPTDSQARSGTGAEGRAALPELCWSLGVRKSGFNRLSAKREESMSESQRTRQRKTRAMTRARNRSMLEFHKAGVSYQDIAVRVGLDVAYVRRIVRDERAREALPPLRARLPTRTQHALMREFHCGEMILDEPARFVELVTQEELLASPEIGPKGVMHIARELRRLGYTLRARRPLKVRPEKPTNPRPSRLFTSARNQHIHELHKKNVSDEEIAVQWGMPIPYVRQICREQRERTKWPPLRRALPAQTQLALVQQFRGDWTIFSKPGHIVKNTSQKELKRYKGMGARRVAQLTEELARLGFDLPKKPPRW